MLRSIRVILISAALGLALTACNAADTAGPDKATTAPGAASTAPSPGATVPAGTADSGNVSVPASATAPPATTVPAAATPPATNSMSANAPAPVAATPANPASSTAPRPRTPAAAATDAQVSKVTVPAGTLFTVVLNDSISTNTSKPGDVFSGSLAAPIVIQGKTVLEKGAAVQGRVVEVEDSGRVKGRARLSLALTSVASHGKTVPIKTKTYTAEAKDSKDRDTKIIGGGAAVGAIVGAVAGGGKGAAEGAAIGAGAGTGTVLATKGEELRYPPETRLSFELATSVSI